ncbi:hypothetical protein [Shewanella violacea]|uniref:Outer membrane protein n=1 Tax=Shewanella violacea (strain JCM 10179 / CIP 106290 / LMG 19151 / DSS12) TaxID=637905 RepID=D4ZAR0_SHEVD|nr:hypothetical protein [Shewanella violacea]BAJ03105.1 hypothetical protein SVI_3134 [Shewanella violacea DSS12]
MNYKNKMMIMAALAGPLSFGVYAGEKQQDESPFWQSYFVHSSTYFQQQSSVSTTSNGDDSKTVSSQNLMFDTYAMGRLGNSTYFGFVEGVFGKLNGSKSDNPGLPYGDDLLQIRGQFSQQWSVTKELSVGWNYFGLSRNMAAVNNDNGKFGYSFDSAGIVSTYRMGKWMFMPQLNYVFNGDMGKDGMFNLGSDKFTGLYFMPIVRRQIADNGAYVTLLPEYFTADGDGGSEATYVKLQFRVGAPITDDGKLWVNARFEHQKHYDFIYRGVDLAPDTDTTVSVGIQYSW